MLSGGCHLLFPFQVDPPDGADAAVDGAAADYRADGPTADGPAKQDGPAKRDGPQLDLAPPDAGPVVDSDPSSDVAKPDAVLLDSGPCPTACIWGCTAGMCKGFWPSNTNSMALAAVKPLSCGTLTLNSTSSFDTQQCRVFIGTTPSTCVGKISAQPTGPSACYFYFKTLNITSTAKVNGGLPLILLVEKMAVISGGLFAGAKGHEAGPGGHPGGKVNLKGDGLGGGGVCTCIHKSADDCGGGGGGYASVGGPGSAEGAVCLGSAATVGSVGGTVYGKASLTPLEGGSGGAAGHYGDALGPPGLGGGGGGAVQISAQTSITIGGAISAGGGGGHAANYGSDPRAGGGGGSGGAVLLEAPLISGGGWVAVNGGGGAAGAAAYTGCQQGENAHPDNVPAKGGNPSAKCTAGGIGAVGGSKGAGAASPVALGAGAGGGGGVGWIRFNWSSSKPTVSHSGNSSQGTLVQIPTP